MTKLENKIKKYNKAYREGKPLISDQEYDQLLEQLREENPESSLLQKAVIEEASSRMQELPLPMFSLEKVKSIGDLKKFIKNNWSKVSNDRIVITPKYDGISLCVDERSGDAWTRGDGIIGQASRSYYELLQNHKSEKSNRYDYTFGEAIFKIKDFEENKGSYKSARNCVAGLFNASTIDPLLKSVSYVRYGSDNEDFDKIEQLEFMSSYCEGVTKYWITSVPGLLQCEEKALLEFFNNLFEKITDYKCDGLVIELNDQKDRRSLGRLPNGNPRYAIAFKNPEWSERSETTVKKIEWNISKDGKAKPVLLFDPVELCGATVQRASAHNAKYLLEHHICEGAIITIARSGDVIPKHIKTLKYDPDKIEDTRNKMQICPCCHSLMNWDNTMTEMVCENPNCKAKKLAQLVFAFSVLGTEEFREPTIKKFFEAGYTTVSSIIELSEEEIIKIDGIGEALSKVLSKQFEVYRNVGFSFAKILTACNLFEGVIAEKTCQMIIDNLSEEDLNLVYDLTEIPVENLLKIKGVAMTTAEAFNKGLRLYKKCEENLRIRYIETPGGAESKDYKVCFSGFRDKELENKASENGYEIMNSVSSKTSILVVKKKDSKSSKIDKAKQLGVPVVSKEEFEKMLG